MKPRGRMPRHQSSRLFGCEARDQHPPLRLDHRGDDALEVLAVLPGGEHRLGDAAPDLTMQVELGFTEIDERELRQPLDRFLERDLAACDRGEQRAQLVLAHRSSASAGMDGGASAPPVR